MGEKKKKYTYVMRTPFLFSEELFVVNSNKKKLETWCIAIASDKNHDNFRHRKSREIGLKRKIIISF